MHNVSEASFISVFRQRST